MSDAADGVIVTLAENPLRTRSELSVALFELCRPALARLSPGRARLRVGTSGAAFSRAVQDMEGFCRLLWGLAPYAAGRCTHYEAISEWLCQGLANGTDPDHPEYWGTPGDCDQRLVELAAIAYSLLLAPAAFWTPLTRRQRQNVASYLGIINVREVRDNNWLLFRILINDALASVDAPCSRARVLEDLARLDSFYLGDGWYGDGPGAYCDYYCAFAFHFYALLHAALGTAVDRPYASLVHERARRFAAQFMQWFSADGSAVPFGRSVTYRFAQGAFWGALAFACSEPPAVGVVKGILLRHLRWWSKQAIVDESGLLTIGYGYEQALIAERYTSPCSPYWALKAFLPLALSDEHAFWQAVEEPLPPAEESTVQPVPGMIVVRHGRHVYGLGAARAVPQQHLQAPAKYAKFAYSTAFGFSVAAAPQGEAAGAHDSALALTRDGDYFRVRTHSEWSQCGPSGIVSRWRPWPDVEITTWLIPASVWHVRVHFIRTPSRVRAVEGAFSCEWCVDHADLIQWPQLVAAGLSVALSPSHASVIVNLLGSRTATLTETNPNTNVLHPRCLLPGLESEHEAGEHWLACAVAGVERAEVDLNALLASRPAVSAHGDQVAVSTARGEAILLDTITRVDHASANRMSADRVSFPPGAMLLTSS